MEKKYTSSEILRNSIVLKVVIVLCYIYCSSWKANAQTKTWVGLYSASPISGATNNFGDPINWQSSAGPVGAPTSVNDVVIVFGKDGTITISGNISINNITASTTGNSTQCALNVSAGSTLTVNGTTTIDHPSTAGNSNALTIGSTSSGKIICIGDATFGSSGFGNSIFLSGTATSNFTFNSNLTLGAKSSITGTGGGPGTVTFDGASTQNISKISLSFNFNNIIIGSQNSPTVILGNVINNITGNVTINNSSILNINTQEFNHTTNPPGGTFSLNNTAKLILGGNSNSTAVLFTNNFPNGFSTITLDSTSTVEYNSTSMTLQAQTIHGTTNGVSSYGNLTLSNISATVVSKKVESPLIIFRTLTIGANTELTIGNQDITLKSNPQTTASFAALGSGASINYSSTNPNVGRFIVERFLTDVSSWRLLATPISIIGESNLFINTINNSWREGATSLASGFGTRITGPSGPMIPAASPGSFDEYTVRGSMKYYNSATNNYVELNAAALANPISRDEGYYVFVRGDRSVKVGATAATTANLRITGRLKTGNQTFNVPKNVLPSAGFQSVGNPYASRIDVRNFILLSGGINESFYVWNPNGGIYNVGRFELYSKSGTDFKKVPGGDILNTIESGQAFFLQNNSATANGSITIKELDKVSGSSLVSRIGVNEPTLAVDLFSNDFLGSVRLLDGVSFNFDGNYNNSFDNYDVRKISNAEDNIGIRLGAANLIVERRKTLTATDTLRLNINNMRVANYQLQFDPSAMNIVALKAYLKDKFLQTETPISLSEITNINFDITNDPNSKVADRFMIVFKKFIPLRFTAITAVRKSDKSINLTWNLENENNIDNYKIERSTDGVNFIEIGSQMPTANNFGNPYYTFYDAKASKEIIYYRIKGNGITGNSIYSNTAKVLALEENNNKQVNIFPNPVTNGNININFEGAVFGNYVITINNFTGQLIKSETFRHQVIGESCIIKILNAGGGFYTANIEDETGIKKMIPFLIK